MLSKLSFRGARERGQSIDGVGGAPGLTSVRHGPEGAPTKVPVVGQMGRPGWFTALSNVGHCLASRPNEPPGRRFPLVVLSVPTGRYVPWAIANGAFKAAPKPPPRPPLPSRCLSWDSTVKSMRIVSASAETALGQEAVRIGGGNIYKKGIALSPVLDGMPLGNSAALTQPQRVHLEGLLDKIEEEQELHTSLGRHWASQCLSPVAIVGDGQEYLRRQLNDVRDADWLESDAKFALAYWWGKSIDPDYMLHVPFTVLSQTATRRTPWIRQVRPRLVVYTRWSYFKRRPPTAFAGVPTVVIMNRRVGKWALECSFDTEGVHSPPAEWLASSVRNLPRGVSVRYIDQPSLGADSSDGEGADDDVDEVF